MAQTLTLTIELTEDEVARLEDILYGGISRYREMDELPQRAELVREAEELQGKFFAVIDAHYPVPA